MSNVAITVSQTNSSGIVNKDDLEPIYVTSFNTDAVKEFHKSFSSLLADDKVTTIPVFIDSYGGRVHALFAMLDIIKASHKPVATIGIGKAMSCGAILLAAGTKGLRFSAPRTDIMIHEVSTVEFGKMTEIESSVDHTAQMNDDIFRFLASRSTKSKEFFLKKMKSNGNVDWFLTSKEFKALGLIDHVGIPTLVKK